ncbi:hypothetical protein ACJO1Z_23215 [Vibrio parahaemolyticus]|uniref:hypothetical protein n=1 Tax=Vibrio parahaemolyticus TaxID=670 RepID=UPI00387AC418|nr:hypothetical protein [Vibrio parahaemolyticus]
MRLLKELNYKWQLGKAKKLSESKGFKVPSSLNDIRLSEETSNLIGELSVSIARDFIPNLKLNGFDPITRYGGDCANVHFQVYDFIKQYYPNLSPELTIGSVYYQGKPRYKFNKQLLVSPEELDVFDAHVWITLGNKIVLDCTISTHLNVNLYNACAFGPILIGEIGEKFEHRGLHNINCYFLNDYSGLVYKPVVLGDEAMKSMKPKS